MRFAKKADCPFCWNTRIAVAGIEVGKFGWRRHPDWLCGDFSGIDGHRPEPSARHRRLAPDPRRASTRSAASI